jgi:hypothetical protein
LLETNLSLRQRHASLVTKTSPFLLAGGASAPGAQAGDNALSPPMSPVASPSLLHPSTPNLASQRHSRRLSTSPAQLAVLSSQNEELIEALGKLQDETSSANFEGKQKLRKLEKEIAGLRAELEQSHLKNGELEERIDSVQFEHERQLELKRQEREARAQELRQSTSKPESASPAFANYAPTSHSPAKPSFVKPEYSKQDAHSATTRPTLVPFPSSDSQLTVTSTRSPSPGEPSAELVVLGQLLSKIEELESTNREILERHLETDSKLRNATSQSDALQKVYENLEDEMEAYADDEGGTFSADQSPLLVGSPSGYASPLLGFRGSFKGRGLGFLYPPSQRVRSLRERGSPVSSLRAKLSEASPEQSNALRKSLNSSLFGQGPPESTHHDIDVDSDHDIDDLGEGASLTARTQKLTPLKPKYSRRRLRPKASLDVQTVSLGKPSISLSPPSRGLRPSASHPALAVMSSGHSAFSSSKRTSEQQNLWNELDNTFDEAGQVRAFKDGGVNDSEGEGGPDLDEKTIVLDHLAVGVPSTTVDGMEHEENRAVAAIRRALDPRNAGRSLENGEHILPVGSLEGSPGESFFLLSHAVEARPNKWIVTAPKRHGLIEDSVTRIKHMALPPSMSLGTDAGEDPWDVRYPDESETEVDGTRQVQRRDNLAAGAKANRFDDYASDTASKRTAALSRLNDAAFTRSTGRTRRRHAGQRFGEDEDNYNDGQGRDAPSREVTRRPGDGEMEIDGWGKILLEIWIVLQVSFNWEMRCVPVPDIFGRLLSS